jgi:hypothetical protein
MQEEQYRQDMEDRDNAGMQAYLRHDSIAQARRALQRSVTDPRSVAFDGQFSSILVSPLAQLPSLTVLNLTSHTFHPNLPLLSNLEITPRHLSDYPLSSQITHTTPV